MGKQYLMDFMNTSGGNGIDGAVSNDNKGVGGGQVTEPGIGGIVNSDCNAKYLHIGRDKIGKLSRDAKEDTFYGLWNLDIPYEMAVAMNPSELIGAYAAAAYIKKNGSATIRQLKNGSTKKVTFDELKNNSAEDVISILNQIFFYNEPRIFRIRDSFPKHKDYKIKSGELKKRISKLGSNTKEAFLASFRQPYKCSNRQNPENFSFHDPTLPEGSRRTPYPVRAYVQRISDMLKSRYEK